MFHRAQPPAAPVPPTPVTAPTLPPLLPPNLPDPALSQSEEEPVSETLTSPAGVPVILRKSPGFHHLDDEGRMVSEEGWIATIHAVRPLVTAFAGEFGDDAHFVCYGTRNRITKVQDGHTPRLNKACLALMGSELGGPELYHTEVFGHALAIDYDLPGHGDWTATRLGELATLFDRLGKTCPIFSTPTVFYTTEHGLRLVWALSRLVGVDVEGGLQDLLAGIVALARLNDFPVDMACVQWTWIFRLPRVVREAVPAIKTSAQKFFRQSWGRVDFDAVEDAPTQLRMFDPSTFVPISAMKLTDFTQSKIKSAQIIGEKWKGRIGIKPMPRHILATQVNVGEMPTMASVPDFMTNVQDSSVSAAYNRVKTRLSRLVHPKTASQVVSPHAQFAYDILFQKRLLLKNPAEDEQGLHEGMGRLANALCHCFRDKLGDGETQLSAQNIYAMVRWAAGETDKKRPPLQQRSEEKLSKEAWRWVSHVYRDTMCYLLDQKRVQDQAQEDAVLCSELKLAQDTLCVERIQEQLIAWIQRDAVSRPEPEPEHIAWVKAHWMNLLIIDAGKYGKSALQISNQGDVTYSRLMSPGTIFTAIRDCNHELIKVHKKAASPESEPELKAESRLLHECGSTAVAVHYSRLIAKTTIDLAPDGDALEPILKVSLPAMRTDITPVESEEVAKWLRLIGGDQTDQLLDWLACFTRIHEPMCGLYIQGEPSIGKGMLGQALTRMTVRRKHAKLETVLEPFQDIMMMTPFVWGDEDVTTPIRTSKSVMNTFKKLVSGEYDTINQKGTAATQIEGHWRTLITANNDLVLKMDDDINEADLNAIIVRTLHIKANSAKCRDYLESIGGRGNGEKPGTRDWVHTTIPCHIAWLAATRVVKLGGRFLVEGVRSEYHNNLSRSSGVGDLVVRQLGRILSNHTGFPTAAIFKRSDLFVVASGVKDALNLYHASDLTRPRFTDKSVGQALRSLTLTKERVTVWWPDKDKNKPGSPKRAWPIDIKTLLQALYNADADWDQRSSLGVETWEHLAPVEAVEQYREAQKAHAIAGIARITVPTSPSVPPYSSDHPYANGSPNSIINALKPVTARG